MPNLDSSLKRLKELYIQYPASQSKSKQIAIEKRLAKRIENGQVYTPTSLQHKANQDLYNLNFQIIDAIDEVAIAIAEGKCVNLQKVYFLLSQKSVDPKGKSNILRFKDIKDDENAFFRLLYERRVIQPKKWWQKLLKIRTYWEKLEQGYHLLWEYHLKPEVAADIVQDSEFTAAKVAIIEEMIDKKELRAPQKVAGKVV